MNLWQQYVCPTNLADALRALRDAETPVAAIAGGTDLLLDLGQGRHSPTKTLVDLTSVAEMRALEVRADQLFIGAAVPLADLSLDPLVAEHAMALAEACDLIGGPQVRNVATLGGNVAHALPAADGTIALVALDAAAEIASLSGTRRAPITNLFEGPGKSTLKPCEELIVGFHIPATRPHEGSAFRRVMRPQGVALPIINIGAWIKRDADSIGSIRIVIAPAGPTPRRATLAESVLVGHGWSEELCWSATNAFLSEAGFRSSPRRATADYRRQLVLPLLIDAVGSAWSRTWQ